MSKFLFAAITISTALFAGYASAHPGHITQAVADHSHVIEYIAYGVIIAGLSIAAMAVMPRLKSILRLVKGHS